MKTYLPFILALCVYASSTFAQVDPFTGRPTAPGVDIASDNLNPPVKKEKFLAKLERYKNAGFKVAVVLDTPPAFLQNGSASPILRPLDVSGNILLNREDFLPLLQSFTKKLNEELSTDLFEIVDMSTIPYKDVGLVKFDNWEGTIYKMVLTYVVHSLYSYEVIFPDSNGEKWSVKYRASINVSVFEYVDEKKGVKRRTRVYSNNLASYHGEDYEYSKDLGFSTMEELENAIGPLKGADLAEHLAKVQEEQIVKFIEKRKKK